MGSGLLRPTYRIPGTDLEAGRLTPVIDRTFDRSEAAEAIRYLMDGQRLGRIVLTMRTS